MHHSRSKPPTPREQKQPRRQQLQEQQRPRPLFPERETWHGWKVMG